MKFDFSSIFGGKNNTTGNNKGGIISMQEAPDYLEAGIAEMKRQQASEVEKLGTNNVDSSEKKVSKIGQENIIPKVSEVAEEKLNVVRNVKGNSLEALAGLDKNSLASIYATIKETPSVAELIVEKIRDIIPSEIIKQKDLEELVKWLKEKISIDKLKVIISALTIVVEEGNEAIIWEEKKEAAIVRSGDNSLRDSLEANGIVIN